MLYDTCLFVVVVFLRSSFSLAIIWISYPFFQASSFVISYYLVMGHYGRALRRLLKEGEEKAMTIEQFEKVIEVCFIYSYFLLEAYIEVFIQFLTWFLYDLIRIITLKVYIYAYNFHPCHFSLCNCFHMAQFMIIRPIVYVL